MKSSYKRRQFLHHMGQAAVAVPGLSMLSFDALSESLISAEDKLTADNKQAKKLGIALVGLGQYSEEQLAPALQETKNCRLAGIVTGTPDKVGKWKEKYNIPDKNVYNYLNFDSIKDNSDIDIVYIVLPNSMHAEYTIRAAKAGKHVICEKPMATSVKDCEAMIQACKEAGKMLSIGYRLHFEPHNIAMANYGSKKTFGKVKKIIAIDSQEMEAGAWRLDRERAGGGPLMDLGVYCVQGALYTVGENPVSVSAKEGEKTDTERFAEVEQSIDFQLEFPGGAVANCHTSYAEQGNTLRAEAEKGWFELDPAYGYDGLKGKTSKGDMDIENVNQQALQMDDFADCVANKKPTRVPGEMGLRDVKILMAIYEAARTGKPVALKLA
ncbi:Gfo/Idh/MocA family protein [Dyadobacter sediminis]|uniref:Gfo/Idh/MocA family oxidoreductase n=1 Tax=Dyadobacter sediminis TaxID=1493691 RepID=A0A5R9KKZ1_9BACT|nr:Gfo/Idh/MocA family oxidoreductase [Dyadobacter sediminis]TLU96799.1 Gfo/Idh/MocA family oxidoreductase [Dyadobacter sediminis]GGB85248.1 glucose-fructose oxidoreductase [Dyadobacter sediminis]